MGSISPFFVSLLPSIYCEACKHEKLVAFSSKGRGFCPSCDAKFRFVFSERSALELGLAKRVLKEKISKNYDSVLGLVYKDVASRTESKHPKHIRLAF